MFIQILSKLSLSKSENGPNSGNLKYPTLNATFFHSVPKTLIQQIFLNGNCITQSDTVKDLGITIDSDSEFKHHINTS